MAYPLDDDLDLDVTPGFDVRLDEDGAVAEGPPGLGARRPRSRLEAVEGAYDRMPRPPPPAEAFTSRGRSASVGSAGAVSTGTPASAAISLAPTLSPMDAIDSGGGPTQVSPASLTARAKSAFSERKP